MNRGKRSIFSQLRKKMSKAIRAAQTGMLLPEERKYSDELTEKEMLKKYPKRIASKTQAIVQSMKKSIQIKHAKNKKNVSKRTTPGTVPSNSTPASVHREGKRWIESLTKQTLSQRTIQAHRGRKK